MTKHHVVRFWIIMLVIFLLVFLLAFISLRTGKGVLNIMPYRAEDWSIMILSIIGIVKSIVEIA